MISDPGIGKRIMDHGWNVSWFLTLMREMGIFASLIYDGKDIMAVGFLGECQAL